MYKIKGLEKYRRPIPRLNDGQFKAIHDSLAKWQFLSWHPNNNWNVPSCVCCEYRDSKGSECDICPVYNVTNEGCSTTPWWSWHNVFFENESFESKDKAEDEYHFLEGIYSIEMHRRKYGKMYE